MGCETQGDVVYLRGGDHLLAGGDRSYARGRFPWSRRWLQELPTAVSLCTGPRVAGVTSGSSHAVMDLCHEAMSVSVG